MITLFPSLFALLCTLGASIFCHAPLQAITEENTVATEKHQDAQPDVSNIISKLARTLEEELHKTMNDKVEGVKDALLFEQLKIVEKRIKEQQNQLKMLEKLGSSLEKLESKDEKKKQTLSGVIKKSFGQAFSYLQSGAEKLIFSGLDATGKYAALLIIASTCAELLLPGAGIFLVTTSAKVLGLIAVNGYFFATTLFDLVATPIIAAESVAGTTGAAIAATGTGYGLYSIYMGTAAALSTGAAVVYNFFGQELALALMMYL